MKKRDDGKGKNTSGNTPAMGSFPPPAPITILPTSSSLPGTSSRNRRIQITGPRTNSHNRSAESKPIIKAPRKRGPVKDEVTHLILDLNEQSPTFTATLHREPLIPATLNSNNNVQLHNADTVSPEPMSLFARLHAWMQANLPIYARLTTVFSKHVATPVDLGAIDVQDTLGQVLKAIFDKSPAANSLYDSTLNKVVQFTSEKPVVHRNTTSDQPEPNPSMAEQPTSTKPTF